jgi:hypothetical protein
MFYDLISHSPHPSNDPSRLALESHADGMIGSVTTAKTSPSPTQNFEVNSFESTLSQQPRGKKKNKGKSKNYSNPKNVDTQLERKDNFPYMNCVEDHYMKDFPHQEEVAKFFKCTSQPVD